MYCSDEKNLTNKLNSKILHIIYWMWSDVVKSMDYQEWLEFVASQA